MRPSRLLVLGALAIAALLLQGCAPLPSLADRTVSTSLHDTAGTRLGRIIVPLAAEHPGLSGVVPLLSGRDAFAARVRLADAAERSLDVQYYIWHKDLSGTLLLDALRRAADRGVRVRMLLDDNNTGGLDATLAALDAQPNIEVRLFNPFKARSWRPLGYLFDFARLNRRMHNKSYTADNQATVIGGRNVGDEYFGAAQDLLFVDLDVLAIGPVVADVSRDFDRYWASASSYPAGKVLPPIDPASIAELAAAAAGVEHEAAALAYMQALAESPFVRSLLAHDLHFEWAPVHMVSDDPAKGLGRAPDDELMWPRLKRVMKKPTRELDLVSPYFVPGTEGVQALDEMARSGVAVTVLTNSLAATDVAAVHAGYAKRRKALLEAGVALYEMKLGSSAPAAGAPPGNRGSVDSSGSSVRTRGFGGSDSSGSFGNRGSFGSSGSVGSSASSLHAKTFSVDDAQIFIGSFNFDPRSARLNTEMGFVIDSPTLAQSISDTFARRMPERAYEVRLAPDGSLRWVEHAGGAEIVHDREPGTTFWKRLGVSLMSLLPIDWLL